MTGRGGRSDSLSFMSMPLACIHWIWAARFSAKLFDSSGYFAVVGKALRMKVSLMWCLNSMSTIRSCTGFLSLRLTCVKRVDGVHRFMLNVLDVRLPQKWSLSWLEIRPSDGQQTAEAVQER